MKEIINLIRTDLIQSKKIDEYKKFSHLNWILFLISSRTCRIHAAVRLLSTKNIFALMAKIYLKRFFIEIGSSTRIGEYFFMPHPQCIIIANDVIIGNHVHIGQYVTIGGNLRKKIVRSSNSVQIVPNIGNNVMISPGAVIGGPVIVGNEVIIGANAVVTKDIPDNRIVTGFNQISSKEITIPDSGGEFKVII